MTPTENIKQAYEAVDKGIDGKLTAEETKFLRERAASIDADEFAQTFNKIDTLLYSDNNDKKWTPEDIALLQTYLVAKWKLSTNIGAREIDGIRWPKTQDAVQKERVAKADKVNKEIAARENKINTIKNLGLTPRINVMPRINNEETYTRITEPNVIYAFAEDGKLYKSIPSDKTITFMGNEYEVPNGRIYAEVWGNGEVIKQEGVTNPKTEIVNLFA